MGERRDRNNRAWAQGISVIPIVGGQISQGIMQNSLSRKQREEAAKINPIDPEYKESPYAKEQLAMARNAQNARMPGSQAMEGNVFRNQSNTLLNISRSASSPQAMMAAAGAVQGGTNNALNNLAVQEAQYKTSMLSNTNNALQGMVTEGNKVYNDQLRKYQRDFDMKQNLLNSSQENFSNSLKSASGASDAAAKFALQMFGMPGGGGAGAATGGMNLSGITGGAGGGGINLSGLGGLMGGGVANSGQAGQQQSFQINPYQGNGWFFNK